MGVPAVVVAYDPGWPGLFRQLRDRVDAALAGVAHVTEHVGSTAVLALAAAGWQHQGDLDMTGRETFQPPDLLRQARG